jgi:predicted RNA-binding Zn-ribbon protein involved in translation (DUF1610 family)
MMGREKYDWESDDSEDESFHDERDEDHVTIECPECGESVFDDAERCPHCENYIVTDRGNASPKPLWITLTVLLCIYAMLHSYLWPLLFG